jgi:transketolase
MATLDEYAALARQLRADSIRASTAAGSGHPTSSLSVAGISARHVARAVDELAARGRRP